MSGQPFSYPLRPGKFVDRGLFVELLQYVDRGLAIRDAAYIGFGGPCMEDHRVIHAAIGLKRMISLEKNADVFAQQQFNRPLREIVCVNRDAKDFVDEFELHLKRAKVTSAMRRIMWFDYQAPGELMHQLQTLQALIDLANDGDIVRVTLNVHAGSLGGHRERETEAQLQKRRMAVLRNRFGDFLPDDLPLSATQNAHYPDAVLEALKLAVLRATGKTGRTFLPLLLVRYADGQPMLTATGIVLADSDVESFLARTGLRKWPYFAAGWSNVEMVFKAPYLTMRERMHMDQAVLQSAKKLPAKLEYLARLQDRTADELAGLYRRYQRFFPRFQHVDM